MHKKIGKDCACGLGDRLADRQTGTHTHTLTDTHIDVLITIVRHHCCAGEVKITNMQVSRQFSSDPIRNVD